jgi:hypothetical protein
LLAVESNPYKIWKALTDQRSNQYFLEVFLNQKMKFGIDYREINKLLLSKKIYEREYNEYKALLDE